MANRCSCCTQISFTERHRRIWAFLTTDEQVGLLDDHPVRRLQGTHLRSQNGGYNVGKIEEFLVIPMPYDAIQYWWVSSQDKLLIPKPFAKILIPIGYDIERDRDVHDNGLDVC